MREQGNIALNAVRQIQSFNLGRDPERLSMKYRAMRASTFAFLRGTCHLFYDRLPVGGVFKSAPLTWACGDLHLENFGSYKSDNRLVYFDINDFDESALAPASWDLVRLLTSIRVAAESLSIDEATAQVLCKTFLDVYASSLAQGKAYWVERDTAQGLVRALLDDLRSRQRASFLDSRTVVKKKHRLLRVDGKKALPVSDAQRTAVTAFMKMFSESQGHPDFFSVLDVGRRIAGTGSLGVDRYVILVQGKGSPDGNYLLDLKRALPSSLLPHLRAPQPGWKNEAQRIVTVQRRMQAVSMAFLEPAVFESKPYVLRALQPSEDRVAVQGSRHPPEDLDRLIQDMAQLVAWAQLRSTGLGGSAIADELIDFGQRAKWKGQLLAASQECAEQVRKDSGSFTAAWDAGEFGS